MKKSINKIILILIAIIIGTSSSSVLATDLKTELNIVQKSSEKKYLENDQGYISKSIVDIDSDNGEVTIELKLSNTKKVVEEKNYTEVVLLMDNSHSMKYKTNEICLNSTFEILNTIILITNIPKSTRVSYVIIEATAHIINAINFDAPVSL